MKAVNEFTILHLSDFHFSQENNTEQTAEDAVSLLIKDLPKAIDFVVITGDITDKGSRDGFKMGLKMLRRLKQKLGLHPSRFVFVPGNHDVNCSNNHGEDGKTVDRFGSYISFVNEFKHSDKKCDNIIWGIKKRSADKLNTAIVYKLSNFPVNFLLLNSVSKYNTNTEKTVVERSEIDYFQNHAKILRREKTIKIAVVHNAPVKFSSSRTRKIIQDSSRLMNTLQDCGVSVLLHGDFHDAQHAAAAKCLGKKSWPLYVLGAGRSGYGGAGVPHFHLLNLKCSLPLNCAEIEVQSYLIRENELSPLSDNSYTLYVPLGEGKCNGSIHMFELPDQNRRSCKSRLVKDLLFDFRAYSFESVKERTFDLVGENQSTQFLPNEMFSLFYKSIFATTGRGDFFRAVHHKRYKVWLEDTPCFKILTDHVDAAIKGLNIERFVILTKTEIEEAKSNIDCFLKFCKLMAKKTIHALKSKKHFITYVSREEDLQEEYISECQSGKKDTTTMMIEEPGNIALYTKSCHPQQAHETNSLGFFYTVQKEDDVETNVANLTRRPTQIKYIKSCINILDNLKKKKRSLASGGNIPLLVDCRLLVTKKLLKKFLEIED